jgi:PAS domain S-box-containing protein
MAVVQGKTMNDVTRILIVEDQASDYELAQREIGKSLKHCVFQRVETHKDFLNALRDFAPDLILSNYSLPAFDGMKALKLAQKHAPLTPLIIWTGSISEDTAVDCMKAGAANYVLKENIKRLAPAVLHALKERQVLLERSQAETTIRDLSRFPEENPSPILRVSCEGKVLYANTAGRQLLEQWNTSIGSELPEAWKEQIRIAYQQDRKLSVEVSLQESDYSVLIVPIRQTGYINLYGNDISHIKHSESALRAREQELRTITEHMNELICRFKPDGTLTYVNRMYCEYFGKTPEELLGTNFISLEQEDINQNLSDHFKSFSVDNPVHRFEQFDFLPKGRKRWREWIERGVFDEQGRLAAIQSTGRDITLLKEAEEKYQSIFENSPIGIFQSTPRGKFISVNPAMAHIYGYESPEEMISTVTDIGSQLYAQEEERQHFTRLLETQDIVHEYELENYRKDGSVFWSSTSARIVRGKDGKVLYYEGFLQDITARKQAEEKLAASEKRFRALIENGMDNISLLAEDGTLLWENPAVNRTLGYEHDSFVNRNIFELMHPEDLQWTSHLFTKMVQQAGSQQRGIFRLQHRDGTWRWVEATATNMLDEPAVNAVVVNYRDITERQQSEARINDLLAFNEKILNHSPLGILTYKITGECVFANEKAADIVGTDVKTLLSQNFHKIEAWKKSGLYDLVEKAISTRTVTTGDVHHISTFGKNTWITAHCVTFLSNDEAHVLLSISDITERKKAENSVRESEKRLNLALAGAQMGVWEWNLQTNKIFWSPECFEITGLQRDQFDGKFDTFTNLIYSPDVDDVMASMEKAIANNGLFISEFRITRSDGETRWLSDLGQVECDATDTPIRLIGILQDITQRKRAEFERQTLLEIMQGLAQTDDLQEFFKLIHAAISKVIYAENFFVMLHSKETGLFEEIYSVDEYDPPAPPSRLERSITSYVFRTGEPLLLGKERFDDLVQQDEVELVGTDSASWMGIPLTTSSGTIGVMVVQDYHDENRYSERDVRFLVSIASQVAFAIERKQADIEIQQKNDDLELLNKVNEAVARGQALDSSIELLSRELKRIFSSVGSTIYMLSPDKKSLTMMQYSFSPETANKIEKLLGFAIPKIEIPLKEGGYFHKALLLKKGGITNDPQQIQGWISEFVETKFLSPLAKKIVYKLIPQIYKVLNIKSMIIVPLKSEEEVIGFLDVSSSKLFTSNDLKRIEHIGEQLTVVMQQQQANEKIRTSEERFRQLADNIKEVFWITDAKTGNGLYISQAAQSVWGYASETIRKSPNVFYDSIHPEDKAWVMENIEKQRMEEPTEMEYRVIHPDGSLHWIWDRAFPIFDENGVVQTLAGIAADITERKEAEEAVHQSETKAKALLNALPDLMFRLDRQGTILDYKAEKSDLYAQNELTLINKNLREIAPVEFADLVSSYVQKALESKQMQVFEYQLPIPGRGLLNYEARMVASGRQEVIAIVRDITERKQAEEELRTSEERYHGLFQNLVDGFALHEILTDDQGKPVDYIFLEVNPAFERLTGLVARNIIGRRATEVLPAIENEQFIPIYGQVALTGQPIQFQDYSASLGKYFEINAYSPRLGQFAATFIDVTQRKQDEMALLKSQIRYYDLFDSSPISLWEEDYSLVKKRIEELQLQEKSVPDLNEYLFAHREVVLELASLVKIIDVNRASLQLYHAEHKEELVKGLLDFVNAETILHFRDEIVGLLSSEARFEWEGKDKTLDGEELTVMVNGSIAPGYEENWAKVIVSISDITQRKQAEEEIRRRAQETSALLATSQALTNLDLNAILQSIGYSAQNIFSADGCRIFLMQPDGESLRCVLALHEEGEGLSDLRIKLNQGVTGAVAASGRAEIVNEMQNDSRSYPVPGTVDEAEAIMFAPLKERDRTIGVLSIRRAGSERPFQPADLNLLEAFASMAASAVSNARLYEEAQRRLAELQALYENGLAVGQLLEPRHIGERVIETFARYLSWHHVTIRLLEPQTNELELIAFNLPGRSDEERPELERHFQKMIHKVGQGISGGVVQTGIPIRTGNVHTHPQYVDTQAGIESGLYMPLKIGERVIGVISVESEIPNAFTEQDERLLATLGNQAAVAFENARLYQAAQLEISERHRAQDALWASETHYRQLADSITDILFEMDHDLHFTHWNKASEMLTGIPTEEAIGRSMQEVFGDSEEQSRLEKIYKSILKERQARTFETEIILKGQKRAVEINAYPSARGVSVVAKDITERRLDEALVQKRFELMEFSAHHSLEELMRKTVDEVSELTDSHIGFMHFVEEDQQTIRMHAWSTETAGKLGSAEETRTHDPLATAGIWADALRMKQPIIHNNYESIPDKKGLPFDHVQIERELIIPIIRDERIVAVLGIGNKPWEYTQHDIELAERFSDYAWDITERKRMESILADERNQLARRVEDRTADLRRANSNLARALRVKDEFLANMSHELRTPLNAILGLSESLGEQVAGPLNEKQQKYLSTINESGHHLLSLINDILDLAKIEAGQITLDINKVDVNSVCQASLRMIKQLAQKKNQEVEFEMDSHLGLMWADERRLKQMIVNLLSNAVKFTPESGKLGLEVRGDEAANRVTITVWDRGIGISEQDLNRLFKPFIQLDSGLAREATGTGLGLALVAQMARLHGGSVTVESQLGEGSRFSIQLPWEPALAADASIRLRNTGKFRAIDPNVTNKPRILIIEDTREVVMMLADYLEMNGFNVSSAQDGNDGLAQAKLTHPNLILMDVMMPGMDGFETTQKLRMDPELKDTPIIALTALAMPSDRQRCLEAGMDEYISKPVNLKALVKLVRSILLEKGESKQT